VLTTFLVIARGCAIKRASACSHQQASPDIAGGVHVGKDGMDVSAGDQGIVCHSLIPWPPAWARC
jgi:S-adenosylmethionine synthetase